MIQGHGDDRHRYDTKVVADFSSNVVHHRILEQLIPEITSIVPSLYRYPEPDAASLNEAIAVKNGLPKDYVLSTNGATEAFYLLAKLFEHRVAGIFVPAFAEYADACRINHIQIKKMLYTSIELSFEGVDLVWLCNPNNPTGLALPADQIITWIRDNPTVTWIVDEAYIDFTFATCSTLDYISELPNLIVVRSLTKSFAVAGVRLGYIAAQPKWINALLKVKMPWSVNGLAIALGQLIINKEQELQFDKDHLFALHKQMWKAISSIKGITPLPTNAHFGLLQLAQPVASKLKQYLLEQHGVLVRDASNFAGLDQHFIRVASQSEKDNNLLIKALKEWSQQ